MASERSQRKGKDKWREKSWYTLMAPDYLGGKEMTTSPSSTEESMVGRKVEIPVSDFTGNFKRSSAKMVFKVVSCQGSKCQTVFIGHNVSDDHIRRMVRRRKERIDIITDVNTTDNYTMTVKIVIVTDGKLTNTKRGMIRKTTEQFFVNHTKDMDYAALTRYVIGEEIYNDIINAAKDLYPIRKVEIRKSALVGIGEAPQAPAESPIEEPETEEHGPEQVS